MDRERQLVPCSHPGKCLASGPSGINFKAVVSSLCVGETHKMNLPEHILMTEFQTPYGSSSICKM